MNFHAAMEVVVLVFEVAGVAIFAIGTAAAGVRATLRWLRGDRARNFELVRRDIGRSILLGLEVLIIADIVYTIIVDLSLESAITLSIIVLVRTFLSFSLEVELEGALPWKFAALRRASATATSAPESGSSS